MKRGTITRALIYAECAIIGVVLVAAMANLHIEWSSVFIGSLFIAWTLANHAPRIK